jgi:hypothetical protein
VKLSRRNLLIASSLNLIENKLIANDTSSFGTSTDFKLLKDDFSIEQLINPPEILNDYKEALVVYKLKGLRTSKKINEIITENNNFIPLFWETANLTENNNNLYKNLMYSALNDTASVVLKLKEKYNRLRPSYVLPKIKPIIEVPIYSSYPSGHATQAKVLANFFSLIQPSKRKIFHALANRIGINREIAGLHYHSDTEAGFLLAEILTNALDIEKEILLQKICSYEKSHIVTNSFYHI